VRPTVRTFASAILGILILAGSARATWIEGKVFCDDGDTLYGPGDTPINGVVVRATSDNGMGTSCTDTTGDAAAGDGTCLGVPPAVVSVVAGYYRIMLPHVDDTYILDLPGPGIPAGASVLNPFSGQYSVFIDSGSGDPSNARKTRNFLLHECPGSSTTSTTHQPTTSTHQPTTSSSSSTSTTHTTNTTSSTSTSSTAQPTTSSTTSTSATSTSSTSSSSTTVTSTTSTTRVTTPLEFCEETLDHLKCYRVRRNSAFNPNGVSLEDQFEDVDMTVLRPYRLCNPVDKEDEGINDPTEHQMCYQIRDTVAQPRFRRREVRVENQFGTQILVVTRPETLCTPAEKDNIVSDLNGDRMKCYRVVQKVGQRDFEERVVTLEDQFETKETTVIKPVLLCNPVALDDDPITSPTCHQVCYRIDDVLGQPDFVPVPVTVQDEFYDLAINPFRGECRQVSLLCVPSLKTELE
jgi:hypothetical protein